MARRDTGRSRRNASWGVALRRTGISPPSPLATEFPSPTTPVAIPVAGPDAPIPGRQPLFSPMRRDLQRIRTMLFMSDAKDCLTVKCSCGCFSLTFRPPRARVRHGPLRHLWRAGATRRPARRVARPHGARARPARGRRLSRRPLAHFPSSSTRPTPLPASHVPPVHLVVESHDVVHVQP